MRELRQQPFSAKNKIRNAEGLIREALLNHSHEMTNAGVRDIWKILAALKGLEMDK